jgi:hypothetical protein
VVVEIKALACARPAELDLPLARLSSAEIARVAVARDIVEAISTTTVWRWLAEDALRPWHYRSWIFPRDPDFEAKAGPGLELYAGRWDGRPLRADEHVVCADERRAFRPAPGSIPEHRQLPVGPPGSSTSTSGRDRSPTWRPGTSGGPRSSAAASPRPGSSRSIGSSSRS